MKPKYSIIIPTYNEKANIKALIDGIYDVLQNKIKQIELIIVDDDSPDKTWMLADSISLQKKEIIVVRRIGVKGLNSAILSGFKIARGDFLGVMDADFQHDLSILPILMDEIQNFDIVIGSRYLSQSEWSEFPLYRKILSKLGTNLVRTLLNQQITDPLSGFFFITQKNYIFIHEKIQYQMGFKLLAEIMTHLESPKIKEVPYKFNGRRLGESKMSYLVMKEFLHLLWKRRNRLIP